MSGSINYAITATDRATAVIKKVDAALGGVGRRVAAVGAATDRFVPALDDGLGKAKGVEKLQTGLSVIGRRVKTITGDLGRFAPALAGLTGAASLVGLARLTTAWSDFSTQLGNNAARIGVSAASLHGLQGAARLTGSSADALTGGMQTLGDNLVNAVGGRAPEVVNMLGALGISFRDAGTGGARLAEDALPEIADKIAAIRNPALQARAAVALFGGAGEALLPFLRKGSAGIAEYNAQARAYGVQNAAGVEAARQFREEQTRLSLAVEGVGYSISERLAPTLIPMLRQLSDWVGANRGKISGFFGELATSIKGWADGGGFTRLLDFCKDLSARLGRVMRALGQVIRAAQAVGRILREDVFDPIVSPKLREQSIPQPAFGGQPDADPQTPPPNNGFGAAGGWWSTHAPTWLGGSGDAGGAGQAPSSRGAPSASRYGQPANPARTSTGDAHTHPGGRSQRPPSTATDTTLTPEARGLLDTIAGTESPGYNVMYGGQRFSDMSHHPDVANPITSGPNAGKTSSAAGRYQFLKGTWDEAQQALKLPDFSPASQDRAAWWLAQRDYRARTGRDLSEDLHSKDPAVRAGIGAALGKTWTSLPGGIEAGTNTSRFARQLDTNTAREQSATPPVQMAAAAPPPPPPAPPAPLPAAAPPPAPAASGNVTVRLTHDNPPPGLRQAVSLSGDVDFDGPRVEHSLRSS